MKTLCVGVMVISLAMLGVGCATPGTKPDDMLAEGPSPRPNPHFYNVEPW